MEVVYTHLNNHYAIVHAMHVYIIDASGKVCLSRVGFSQCGPAVPFKRSILHLNRCGLHACPSYHTAFNLILQLAQLQLLRQSMPSNWQLASCALEQLAGILVFAPHPTHLRPLTPDAIKDCSTLFPLGSEDRVWGGNELLVQPMQPGRVSSCNPGYWDGTVSAQTENILKESAPKPYHLLFNQRFSFISSQSWASYLKKQPLCGTDRPNQARHWKEKR